MPRTLKNNDSLLNFFVGREAFSPVWSEGQVVQMGPGDQASQGGPGTPSAEALGAIKQGKHSARKPPKLIILLICKTSSQVPRCAN